MIRTQAKSLKPVPFKSAQPYVVSVRLDAFGNAVPESRSSRGDRHALRVVGRQDVVIQPSRRLQRAAPVGWKTKLAATVRAFPAAIGRLLPKRTAVTVLPGKPVPPSPPRVLSGQVIPLAPERDRDPLDRALQRMRHEFNERERRLDRKMLVLRDEQQRLLSMRRKLRSWTVPATVAVAVVVLYMLNVMTSMQGSMTTMAGNIHTMATDTRTISQNMQVMNQSMYQMNQNVAQVNGSVVQMNRNVGTLAQSAAPMGEAASAVSPMTRMFKSMMPF
jgi:uncharacterized protein YoxC